MHRLILTFLALTLCTWAQPTLKKPGNEPIMKIESAPQSKHSTAQALWRSLLIPGLGEHYLGYKQRSATMISTDLALWLGLWIAKSSETRSLSAAHSYAQTYAAQTQLANDLELLQAMNDWRSRNGVQGSASNASQGENYNLDLLRSGTAVDRYMPNQAEYSWDWGPSSNPESNQHYSQYQKLMSQWRLSKISSQMLIGGLILGRALSLIDVVVLSRRSQGLELSTQMSPQNMALTLKGTF